MKLLMFELKSTFRYFKVHPPYPAPRNFTVEEPEKVLELLEKWI